MKDFKLMYLLLLFSALFISCSEDEMDSNEPEEPTTTTEYGLGYTGSDNMSEIPTTINFGVSNQNLPSSASLISKFPPIGNQGRYGTCVSWAVAYNTKTAVSGMKSNLNSSQLANPANQASPKDLFTAIPDDKKGTNCSGTNFESALTVMQERGVASLQTVPYNNLSGCSSSNTQSSWTQEANQNKINYWRKIDPSVNTIKQNIANNIPVIFGARLGDNFMSWSSDDVISSHTSFDNVGIHSYHAMVVGGYDDAKGPNGAFKVINSWGTNWGDSGYIWVDYNFFISDFCDFDGAKPLFIMSAEEGNTPPDEDNNDDSVSSGVDLAAWVFSDYSTNNYYYRERVVDFNIYNIGAQTATAASNWSVYYIYYNAYNANDYGIIYYDEFNTSIPQNTYNCVDGNHCIVNLDLPSNTNFAQEGFASNSITRTYYMPQITGAYYILMVADAQDVFTEQNELNNFFYTTINPVLFNSGLVAKGATKGNDFKFKNAVSKPLVKNLKTSKFNTAVTSNFRNAYTPKEIKALLKREKKNGNLSAKIREYKLSHSKK